MPILFYMPAMVRLKPAAAKLVETIGWQRMMNNGQVIEAMARGWNMLTKEQQEAALVREPKGPRKAAVQGSNPFRKEAA